MTGFRPRSLMPLMMVGSAATVFVAYKVMRHTAVVGRYKTSVETYKLAKEAGIDTEEDERVARQAMRLLADDAREHASKTDYWRVLRMATTAFFIAALAHVAGGGWKVFGYILAVLNAAEAGSLFVRGVSIDANRWYSLKGGTPNIVHLWRKVRRSVTGPDGRDRGTECSDIKLTYALASDTGVA